VKKGVAIFLLCVYGITSVGSTIHFHYCMNELVGWTIGYNTNENKTCDRCGMDEKDGGCCKDEYAVFKINIDQNKTILSIHHLFFSRELYGHSRIVQRFNEGFSIDSRSCIYIDPPPFVTDRRLHLIHCVFLI
jgi:hypothetical protein